MDNRSKVKKLNKKLLVMFVMMLTIFVTLLVVKDNVLAVPAEMESKLQMERDNPTYLTYEDLVGYYDILCCQHGTTLNGKGRVMLTGSNANGGFSYDMGKTTLGVGDTIDRHTHTSGPGSDYDKETYKHRTYGFYSATSYIGRPSESYIIAEMKNELGTENGGPSAAIIHDDGVARKFTGSLTNAIEVASGSGENIYIVNQTYVLETDDGSYYVNAAKDSDGNLYYVYATNADGSLKRYTGDFKYEDPMTGEKNKCLGVSEENVYYEHGGSLESGDVVASKKGTLYLVDGQLLWARVDGVFLKVLQMVYQKRQKLLKTIF